MKNSLTERLFLAAKRLHENATSEHPNVESALTEFRAEAKAIRRLIEQAKPQTEKSVVQCGR